MPLDDTQIQSALESLPGWTHDGAAIARSYTFADFTEGFAFMTRAVGPIEEMDHHPEWSNVFNRVDVRLSSHDVGGVTERDIHLARVLERIA